MMQQDRLRNMEISVVGGGIAGLAASRALALRGARVVLSEATEAFAEVGAGVQISPNGLAVLDALGLGDALREVSVRAEAVELRDGRSGRRVVCLDLSRGAGDYRFVHRARLIEVLAEGARTAGVNLCLGTRIAPGGARLTVAADGIRSEHARVLNPGHAPAFTGQRAWRALIPEAPGAPPVAQVFMGRGRHVVSYPLTDGFRNLVAVEEQASWLEEGWSAAGDPDHLRAAFGAFGPPVRDWLAEVSAVQVWGLFDHGAGLPQWHDDRTVLIGDAAHPMLPFLAQGANMAIEDAWALPAFLDAMPAERALVRFSAFRRPRTARVTRAAAANARNYHLGGLRRVVAQTALAAGSAVAPGLALRKFNWLYGYDVTAAVTGALRD